MASPTDRRRLGGALTVPAALAALAAAASIGVSSVRDRQYHPDSRHYALRTLMMLGRNEAAAKAEAGPFLRAQGVRATIDVLHRPEAGLFKPRVLYPALSAPFVAGMGLAGLLVVPFVSSLAFAVLLWAAVARRAPPWAATGVVALVVGSRTFIAYGPAALTESLSLSLLVAALLAFPDEERAGAPWVAFGATLAAGLARDVTPYLLLAALAGLIWSGHADPETRRAWRRTAAAVGAATALSLAWTGAVGRVGPLFQLERFTHEQGLADMLGALPPVLGRAFQGIGAALIRDVPLALVIAVAGAAAVKRPRSLDAALGGGALAATLALLVLNPISTKFRVQLPLVPFAARLAAVEGAAWLARRRGARAARSGQGRGGRQAAPL